MPSGSRRMKTAPAAATSAQADRPSAACVTFPTNLMKRFFDWFNNLYPVWLVTLAVIAFFKPPVMLWFNSDWVFWSLAASRLGMGLTLSLEDFKAIGRMPGCVALGFIAQYTIMPLAGRATAKMRGLELGLAVGIILVASCPSGMASNMISYLAKANVALSVVLTLFSKLLAFFFTPMWTSTLAGEYVPVDAWGLCKSVLQLTVAPMVLGVLIRWKLPRTADRIGAVGPTIAVIAFVCVTGGTQCAISARAYAPIAARHNSSPHIVICYNVLIEINLDDGRIGSMDSNRKANREANEVTLQYKSRREHTLDEELAEEKLVQLLAVISQLDQTPSGAAELQRRRKLVGECNRIEGETSGQFYARLRHWLDKDLPQTKSPLHAPRQTGD